MVGFTFNLSLGNLSNLLEVLEGLLEASGFFLSFSIYSLTCPLFTFFVLKRLLVLILVLVLAVSFV